MSEGAKGSVISGAVPDGTLSAIDRFFDLVDNGVDHVDRVLNRGKQTAEKHRVRRARRPEVIDTEATPKPSPPKPNHRETPATATALTRRPRFYIVESIVEGSTRFVVTDGGNARTECASREFAEQVLQALERAP